MCLPELLHAQSLLAGAGRVLIIAEGFEPRSLSWIRSQPIQKLFEHAIICRYAPAKRNRFEDMFNEVVKRTAHPPQVIEYDRFNPTLFEQELAKRLSPLLVEEREVTIDISVMSKMLIMIIINLLKDHDNNLRVIYSEPETWKPSETEYVETVKRIKKYESRIALSSIGVCNITRTPLLASVVMQNAPTLLIAFTSSNEQVLNALFNDVVPSSALLINAKSKREPWREKAAIQINHRVINDFHICKSAISSFELLDYISVFNYLAEVYRKNCYNKRIVVSPTGGKIHTLSCAIFKACCQDVHVEYPTPESYHFDDYSSDAVHAIYEVRFPNFGHLLEEITHAYHLDG